jgi:stearoyl-CoA 9-desaturase NADPH oxidoreductase
MLDVNVNTAAPSIWRSPWLRPLNDLPAIDDLLAQVNPLWSLGHIKARLRRIIQETPDTRTFVLEPNRNWPGFRAGQHVLVEMEIGAVRHQRTYSLSSAPADGRLAAITVKRQPGGKVSNWLHDNLRPGDVFTLGVPGGEFVLPRPAPARLLLLSAGSGITPLMSMLRDLRSSGYAGDVAFVHACRSREHAIFRAELEHLAATWPHVRLHLHYSSDAGRLDVGTLTDLVRDHAERHTLLCGPQGFITTFQDQWHARGIGEQLRVEHFGIPAAPLAAHGDAAMTVRWARSQRTFTATGTAPLLVEAERAGLNPRYGCRMGICRTCQCVKLNGTVENLRTGAVSSEPGEQVQLCISRARSDLVLDV